MMPNKQSLEQNVMGTLRSNVSLAFHTGHFRVPIAELGSSLINNIQITHPECAERVWESNHAKNLTMLCF